MNKDSTNQNPKKNKSASKSEKISLDMASSILDTTSDGVIATNLKGEITFWNNGAVKMYKYSKEEILGKHVTLLYKPENEISALDRIKRVLAGERFSNDEVKVLDKSGNTLTVLMSLNGIEDENGEISQIVGITKDITEQKIAQKILKESEQRFLQAFDNSPIPVSILNLKTGKRLAVNNTFCKNFGYTKEELINEENFKKNNIAVDQKEFRSIVKKLLNNGTIFEEPFSMYNRSGDVRQVLVNATKAYKDNNDIYIVSYLDITERKQIEYALISSEKKFRNLAETSQVAIAILREPPENKFIYVNPYWEKLTGYSGKEAKKLTPMDLVEPEFHKVLTKKTNKRRSTGMAPDRNEFKIITKSGESKWVKFTATTIEFDGEKAVLRTGLDITERKNNDQKLLQAKEKAEISKNYLDNIINNIGEPVFVKDEQSKFLLVNNSFCRLIGLTRKEIIGKTLAEDIPPKEQEIFLKIDRQVLKTGKENVNEETLTIRGGVSKTIVTRKTRYKDNNGNKYLIGAISDITDRKIAETELKKAQEIAHLGNWYLDLSSGEITWSDELYKMYGFDPELPIPPLSEHKEFLTPESWDLLNSSIEHTSKTGNPYAIELKTNKKKGVNQWDWILAQGEAIMDSENNVIALRGTAQNITEHKKAEEKLADSENKLKAILDHHFQLTGLLDKEGKILAVNKTALKFIGKKEEDVIGVLFWDAPWWESSQKAQLKSAIESAVKGEFIRFETTHINKSGEIGNVDFSINPVFDDDGNVIYLVPEGRDITDRIIAEEKIKETLTQLNLAVKTAKLGVWSRDAETDELIWNDRLFEIYGISPDEFESNMNSYFDRLHPDDFDYINEVLGSLYEGEPINDVKFRIIRPDNEIRYIDSSAAPLVVNGRIEKYIGINRDVTEQKKAADNLKETLTQLELAVNTAKVGVWSNNILTGKLEWNEELFKIYGIAPSEFDYSQDSFKKLVHPEDLEYLMAQHEKLAQNKSISGLNFRIIRPNNEVRHIIGSVTPIFDDKENLIKIMGINLDVTEDKIAENALRSSEKKFRNLTETARVSIAIFSAASGKGYLYVNPHWEELTGYSSKEAKDLDVLDIVSPEYHEMVTKRATKRLAGKKVPENYELKIITKSGKSIWVDFTATLIDFDNKKAILTTALDITEKKLSAEALKDSEEKYRMLFEQSMVGIGMGRGNEVVFGNKAMMQLYKYNSLEEFKKIPLTNHIAPNSRELVKNRIKEGLSNKGKNLPSEYEYDILCKDGEIKTVRGHTTYMKIGGEIYSQTVVVDVTEKKRAEKKLEQTNLELKAAVSALNELKRQLEDQNVYLKNQLDLVFNFEEMVYGSAVFSEVLTDLERVAPTDATVLILGESGTGKELLARALHNLSLRKDKPFIKVNCSAIPTELIESELFGHKKGSFTGAVSDKLGKFELAEGGTLFLDEIGDLPLAMQPKLLRFLQEGEMEVVGGTTTKSLDIRIVAATNKNLKEEVKMAQFREDLYFRLNVFPIEVPALRDRKEDIPLLVEHFVDKFGKKYRKNIKYISDSAMQDMRVYKWPGNIRELENLVERSVILSDSETLILPGFGSEKGKGNRSISNDKMTLDDVQRNHILSVLEKTNWKVDGPGGAAQMLDIKPSTFRDKMKKLGINRPNK